MKKQFRLLSNEDFSLVIKNGKTLKNSLFVVHYLENNQNNVRVGITASTKLGNAVIRSTTRRKIRAICDLVITDWSMKLDIVIIPKFRFLESSHSENVMLLNELISQIIGIKNEKKN